MSCALALAALVALAQDGGRAIPPNAGIRAEPDAGTRNEPDAGITRLPPQQASAELAKKSVDAAHIELQSARLYVLGLFHLSKPPTTVWDREHSIMLFNQTQQAIGEADRSLAELSGMANGKWEKADQPLRHARQTIVQVQKDLRSISVPPTGSATTDAREVAKRVYDSLDSARKDLESAAKAMDVDSKLRSP
jgi:hypothetical protein